MLVWQNNYLCAQAFIPYIWVLYSRIPQKTRVSRRINAHLYVLIRINAYFCVYKLSKRFMLNFIESSAITLHYVSTYQVVGNLIWKHNTENKFQTDNQIFIIQNLRFIYWRDQAIEGNVRHKPSSYKIRK
jgi:hypothetical protein